MSVPPMQIMLGGGISAAKLTYIAGTVVTSGLLATNSVNLSCGAGGVIALGLMCHVNAGFLSGNIAGHALTFHVQRQAGGTNAPSAIATATGVPAGTNNISVTVGGVGGSVWGFEVYTLEGANLTPTATGSDSHTFGGSSGTLSNLANGCTLGVSHCGNGTSPAAWGGLVQDAIHGSPNIFVTSAHLNHVSANAALAWSANFSGSNNQTAATWASWKPS